MFKVCADKLKRFSEENTNRLIKFQFQFHFQSVVESIVIFVVLVTLSRYLVDARPEPQNFATNFGEFAGAALGAAAGSFARETFGGGGAGRRFAGPLGRGFGEGPFGGGRLFGGNHDDYDDYPSGGFGGPFGFRPGRFGGPFGR